MRITGWLRVGACIVAAGVVATVGASAYAAGNVPTTPHVDQLAADRAAMLSRQTQALDERSEVIGLVNRRAAAMAKTDAAADHYQPTTDQLRAIARTMMRERYGWGEAQFTCYDNIIVRESNWNTTADNPTSSAYGIPQALPGDKMASAGADWKTNPVTQISWGLQYVKESYGTPCSAWDFKKAKGWY